METTTTSRPSSSSVGAVDEEPPSTVSSSSFSCVVCKGTKFYLLIIGIVTLVCFVDTEELARSWIRRLDGLSSMATTTERRDRDVLEIKEIISNNYNNNNNNININTIINNNNNNNNPMVIINLESPVMKKQQNTTTQRHQQQQPLKFYIIEIPFLTSELLNNETHYYKMAKDYYSRPKVLNEDLAEMWIHRGLQRMTYAQGHTTNASEADIFFVAGYNNLRYFIYNNGGELDDFPKDTQLDKLLHPLIIDKSKPHIIASLKTHRHIGIDHVANSLRRLQLDVHSLGYERNEMWQSVSVDRISPIPYVVKPTLSKQEMLTMQQQQREEQQNDHHDDSTQQQQRNHQQRLENYTFFAGDPRLKSIKNGGCNRTHLLHKILGTNERRSINLFFSTDDRLSQDVYNERMQTSEYCLILCGDTPTSRSLTSAMIMGCIPIFIGSRWRGQCEYPCHKGWGWNITHHWNHFPFSNQIQWNVFPEVNEDYFAYHSVELLQSIFERQSATRRHELRSAMMDMQLKWIYGWGNPIDSEEFGEAVPAIWNSVQDHILNFQKLQQ